MKHFRMLAAGLCSAVLLCGFAIPAYAYSDSGNEEPPVVEETPAPEPAPTITPGEGFSEDGNLVTRDLFAVLVHRLVIINDNVKSAAAAGFHRDVLLVGCSIIEQIAGHKVSILRLECRQAGSPGAL